MDILSLGKCFLFVACHLVVFTLQISVFPLRALT